VNKKKSQPNPQLKPKPVKAKAKPEAPTHKLITENRKAKHRFEIIESVECGMVLVGSEVKSLRNGKCSLDEAYARMRDGELWLIGCDIPEYKQATVWNHETKRPRKLLLHARERKRFGGKSTEKGLTLVPLQMYFTERGKAKCVIGLCRGMKVHDKRETLKKADAQRDIQRAMRRK
jgi:SsrA-binding protein